MEKYPIEKNTVKETLVIPLYGRKMCSELYPNLYRDPAARLISCVNTRLPAVRTAIAAIKEKRKGTSRNVIWFSPTVKGADGFAD